MALPVTKNRSGTELFSTFKSIVKENRRFYLIYLNGLAIITILYIIFAPVLIAQSVISAPVLITQISVSIIFSCIVLFYPLFGKIKNLIQDPKKFLFCASAIKIGIVLAIHLLGLFPGKLNFMVDYEYGRTYLEVQILDKPGLESSFYYPPSCSLFFVFLYLTNPWESTLLFGIQMLICDLGISWMIWKITQVKSLKFNAESTANALFFYTFSGVQLLLILFYQKFDFFVIFLSLAGVYYTLQKKWFLSAAFLVFCGFFKVYTFLWIAGILLYFLKTRDWKSFKLYLLSVMIVSGAHVGLFYIIEGFAFFETLLSFGWHFTIWEEAYNLNWSYYLKYLNIPFLNFLPIILILVSYIYYVLFRVKKIDFKFFINSTVILLIFYPSINYHYLIWIIPLIGLNLISELPRYRKAIFMYDVLHVNMDQHIFAWLLLLGYGDLMVVKNITDPGMLVVLVARFIIILPMLIGLILFLIVNNRGCKDQFRVIQIGENKEESDDILRIKKM